MMTKEEQKYALAEWMGYVWYRAPQDHHFPDKKYRFLAFPAIQEYEGQIDIWKQRADGTEEIIDSKEWRKAQGVDYVPNFPECLNAMHEVESKFSDQQRADYYDKLFHTLPCDENVGPAFEDGEDIMIPSQFTMVHASAEQRSNAACRMIFPERWKE